MGTIVIPSTRLRHLVWVACLLALGLTLCFAARAAAIMVKLPSGRYANYDAMIGSKAPRAARIFDAAFTNLDYSGGPVMPSSTNVMVVWQPSNYGGHTAFQTGYTAGIAQFFTDMAAASGVSTNSDSVSTQYNDAVGNIAAYQFQNGGQLTDTDPLPTNGCPAAAGNICITDAQIQRELDAFLQSQGRPADMRHEYFMITPPDVASCFDAAGSACSGNADQQQAYCAYHSQSEGGYIYSNIPDLTGLNGCDPFATYQYDCPSFSCSYDNGPADGVLSAISHEHNESITDPQPNNAWTDWGSSVGGEIGDKCNNDGFADPNLAFGGGGDSPYNEVINGDDYLIQREWSNQGAGCLDGFTPNGTVSNASFTSTSDGADTFTFDASASTATGGVAEYVWQFNDGPGQTGSVETAFPSISHTFSDSGVHYVALTVMAADGTSNGAARDVVSAAPPSASFANSGGAPEGSPVTFDASSSTPGPGTSIASYSWDFGDGTSANSSNAQAEHSYGHYGTYQVTVTVTDADGLSDTSAPQAVSISDEQPTAVFSASGSARAGSPLTFDGTASRDPDGALTRYSWNFGDGTTGSGATVAHVFGTAGGYTVTMHVTDSDGQSAQMSQLVAIAAPILTPPTLPMPSGPSGPAPVGGQGLRCLVPNVNGKILSKAKQALGTAHCTLGKISAPKHKPRSSAGRHKTWKLVVIRETPNAGQNAVDGAPVALKLAYRAVKIGH